MGAWTETVNNMQRTAWILFLIGIGVGFILATILR